MNTRYVELNWAVIFECGCIFGTAVKRDRREFVTRPCQVECENFKEAVGMAAAQRKPLETRWQPGS